MKRYILAGFLSAVSLGLIISTSTAQTVGDVDPGTDSTVVCTNLTYNLKLGSRDSSTNGQVTMLQEFLVMKGLLLVDPTGYFGPATLAAAKAYQSQAGLLTSGYVGPLTRAAIKTASCNGGTTTGNQTSSNTELPVITSISKTSGSSGETVVVSGRNLKDGLYVSWGGASGFTFNPTSTANDGTSFTFVVPNVTPGIYEISANKRGDNASYSVINTVSFTVLSTTYTCPNGTTSHTPCSTSSVAGTIDASSGINTDATTGSRKFVITGTVTGVNVIGISIGNANGKLYGSGHFSVSGQGYRHEIPATASLPFNPGQYTVQLYTETSVLLATRIVTVADPAAPSITLSPDMTTTFGGTATLTWNVTPSTGVSCISAGGNLANGTQMSTYGSWTTPDLYTTTQYGMRCTDNASGLSTTKYVTVTVPPQTADSTSASAPTITLTPDTTIAYGGKTTLNWSVTPATGIFCESAGGNLASGTVIGASGSWTTPNLYTTTQYGMRCKNTSNGLMSYKYTTVTVTPVAAPTVTLSPDTTIAYGRSANITWSVTPSAGVSCVAAGGNLAAGMTIGATGSWTTPNLYTTTQYGMRCTDNASGLSTTKYVTVTVTPQSATAATAPAITLSSDTTVSYGSTSNITWSVTPSTGVSCISAGGNLANGTQMSTTGSWTTPNLYTTTQYGMRCTDNTSGLSSYKYTTVNVTQASAPSITLSPDMTTTFGGTATITWNVTPSTGVSCISAGGNLANGTQMSTYGSWTTPNLYTTTQYGMKCTDNATGLSSIKFVNVSVPSQTADSTSASAPTITLTPDQTIAYGAVANLAWSVTPSAGVSCVAAGGNLAAGMTIGATGSWTTPNLYTNTQYGMRCTNSAGLTSYKYTTVYVATPAAPTVTLTSDKAVASYGGTATLNWSATPSTSVTCVAAGGNIASGTTVGASGSWTTPSLYTTTQYGLRCTNQTNGLSTTKYVTVSVPEQTSLSSSAPIITVSNNVTIPYGGNTTLRWSVTPTTNMSCLVAGGNLASGTSVDTSGYWVTPNLYTTTQYGIKCTNNFSGYSTTKYVTVTVSPQTTTNTTTSAPDACAALDASLYCTTDYCTTNTGVVRYGTKNCAVDACAALDASQYCTTQSCTTNTGVVRYGTKSCPTSSMNGAIFAAQGNMSSVLGVSTQCIDLPTNMHRGYESYAVTRLQEFLKSRNFLGEVTGFYGDKTVAAVKEYQTTKNLPATGMVYDFTRQTIKQETCQ